MPRIICTGYEITDALRKYLEVGHGVDFDKDLATDSEDDDEVDEINSNVDPQKLAMQREAEIVMSYQGYFRSILSYNKYVEHGRRVYMFMPTGAYTLEHYRSGALASPPEEDRKVIQSFIDSMNALLPDDVVREKAELKIEEMRFEVHSPRAAHAPPYYRREREVAAHAARRWTFEFQSSVAQPPACVRTSDCVPEEGYEITDALRRYLEVGHGVDFDKDLAIAMEEDGELGEIDRNVDPQELAMDREAAIIMSYQDYFRSVRDSAPPEIRKALEIPYDYSKWAGHGLRVYMFMPTGAYTLEHYTSGALKSPPEEDRKVIQSFIDSMNSLLPDDVVREKAEFKIEDMRFEVHSPRAIHAPPYYRREREYIVATNNCTFTTCACSTPKAYSIVNSLSAYGSSNWGKIRRIVLCHEIGMCERTCAIKIRYMACGDTEGHTGGSRIAKRMDVRVGFAPNGVGMTVFPPIWQRLERESAKDLKSTQDEDGDVMRLQMRYGNTSRITSDAFVTERLRLHPEIRLSVSAVFGRRSDGVSQLYHSQAQKHDVTVTCGRFKALIEMGVQIRGDGYETRGSRIRNAHVSVNEPLTTPSARASPTRAERTPAFEAGRHWTVRYVSEIPAKDSRAGGRG
ncbi:predicted protein [Postia placenta Mad-698-R]|nr:predicted protein [Postia placenta Mad-698-R]